jgi:hypothetical protein
MEEKAKIIETLIEEATEYGKTSIELIKLKSLDKVSDVVSSFLPLVLVFFLFSTFLLLINLGLAIWLGEILGEISYGFFAVGAFYGILAILIRLIMHSWLKTMFRSYIIKLLLK